jgi:excinuclease ABC subunit C
MNEIVFPNKIMIKEEIEDKELLQEWLSQMAERKVEIKAPQKGEKLRLVEMAENNAQITLTNKEKEKYQAVKELQEILHLKKVPRKIEGYDISNLSGQFIVASMCVLQDGEVKKYLSRNFKIKTVLGQDDPRCMNEVISRRLKHSIGKTDEAFGDLPDVIFVDGGITQIHAAKQAVAELKLKLPIYGMVKDDKHRTRGMIFKGQEILMSTHTEGFKLLTRIQDEVHRFAIEYHRKLREKKAVHSVLDDIPNIGKARKKALMEYFGNIEAIANAEVEQILQVPQMTIASAESVYRFFRI